MAEIVLDRVTKRFTDDTDAVHEASCTIRDGELFVLVGPSGCGKSTLLAMIVGLEDITDGELWVDGRRMNDVDPRHRNMAMVFQSYAIYPHLTVRENLAFPLRLQKVAKAEVARRVAAAAAMLELGELLDRKPAHLSGGQRQRVAMGRAVVREPVAFLMDEPLSNLDAKLRVQMRTAIAALQRGLGTTTVYVTHDQTEAMTLGDRVAVMRGGRIQQIGSPRELYEHPANVFVAGFIGSPAMNLLPGEIAGDRLRLPTGDVAVPAALRDGIAAPLPRRVVVGIRPEHLRVADGGVGHRAEGSDITCTGRVDFVEWMGADLDVHVRLGAAASTAVPPSTSDVLVELGGDGVAGPGRAGAAHLVARLGADVDTDVAAGREVSLRVETERLHLFAADTGDNLRPVPPVPLHPTVDGATRP